MLKYSSVIIGTGSYLPEKILSNNDLAKFIDTDDEWITSRTGIKERRIVAEGEYTSDMASKAALDAIKSSGIDSSEIDMIIVCTTSCDRSFPSVAVQVQRNLGLKNIPAFDMQAVCSGFVYGLATADSFIRSGFVETILVIGADSMSKLVDWSDRATCVLFGDGAGAAIVKAFDANSYEGIITSKICADGEFENILYTDGGISFNKSTGYVRMQGKEVFKHAVEKMSNVVTSLLESSGYSASDVDWLVPHQANARIIDAIAKRLDFPKDKVVFTVDKQANTSAATIPLAIDKYVKECKIKSGDLLVLTALGAGLTWGGSILRWK